MKRLSKAAQVERGVKMADGWENLLTGLGMAKRDKRVSGVAGTGRPLQETEVEDIFTSSHLARRLVELLPDEATREFVEFTGLEEKLSMALSTDLDRLMLKDKIQLGWQWAREYGGGGAYVSVDDGMPLDQPLDLTKIRKVNSITVFNRWELWCRGTDQINDINDPAYGLPQFYYIQPRTGHGIYAGTGDQKVEAKPKQLDPEKAASRKTPILNVKVHHSRVIRFEGLKLPSRKFVENQYWDDSVYTGIKESLRDYCISHGYAANIVHDFSMAVYKLADLAALMGANKEEAVKKRMNLINISRSMLGAVVVDAEKEAFEWSNRSVAGLPDILDRIKGFFQANTDIPHTRLFNESPGGLGKDESGGDRKWYDFVKAKQTSYAQPILNKFLKIIFAAKEGPTKGAEPPEGWGYEWVPLWQPTEGEIAEARNKQANTDQIYMDAGVLDPEEVRNSRFGGDCYSLETELDPALDPVAEMKAKAEEEAKAAALALKNPPAPGAKPGDTPPNPKDKVTG